MTCSTSFPPLVRFFSFPHLQSINLLIHLPPPMPRLPNLLLHTARSLHPDLPLLLRACRDLRSAQNELRWLRQHVLLTVSNSARRERHVRDSVSKLRWTEQVSRISNSFRRLSLRLLRPRRLSQEEGLLHRWCRQRSRGMPLQYILGSQPFGSVDVLCRRGVLIPRCVLGGTFLLQTVRLLNILILG